MAVDDLAPASGLSRLQMLAVVLVGLAAVGLAAYGGATSYISVRDMALAHNVPLARLTPVGIDGGLITVIALDIVLTWIGHPLRSIRLLARLFSLATIAANAMSGWPDSIAVALHITPSVLLVIVVEGVRSALLQQHDSKNKPATSKAAEPATEAIPRLRWLLSPFKTFSLWRRMVLWRVPSYALAIDLELSRRQAVVRLRAHFGDGWKRQAPNDLVWMLRSGVRIPEACARVDLIIAPSPVGRAEQGGKVIPRPPQPGATSGTSPGNGTPRHAAPGRNDTGTSPRNGAGNGPGTKPRNEAGTATRNGAGTGTRDSAAAADGTTAGNGADPTFDRELMDRGRAIIAAFAAEHGRPVTLDEFTPLLGRKRAVASLVRRALLNEAAARADAVAEAQR